VKKVRWGKNISVISRLEESRFLHMEEISIAWVGPRKWLAKVQNGRLR
jgi:hypothetical protein